MADIPISIDAGTSKRLLTEGKYCDKNILVTAADSSGGGQALADSIIDKSVTEVSSNVTDIGHDLFYDCKSLHTVSFPNVTQIKISVFRGCSSLVNVNLPKVKTFSLSSFKDCTSLEKLDFPVLDSIAANVFNGCTNLSTFIIRSARLCPLISVSTFTDTPIESGSGFIYVPKSLVEEYKQASNWTTYADQIRAIEDHPEITGGAQA